MRTLVALILVLTTSLAAAAQSVVATSGEHRDFTRLVLQFPAPTEWQLGRTLEGYALRVAGQPPSYDLTRAFELIGRSRLSALAVDPANGDLKLAIACACHAIPFEFRPGIVVVDLYSGAPPPGSSFEEPLSPRQALAATPPSATTPPPSGADPLVAPGSADLMVSGYDWKAIAMHDLGLAGPPPDPLAPPETDALAVEAPQPDLGGLRETLLTELARGATAGLIDLAPPKEQPAEDHGAAQPAEDHAPAEAQPEHAADPHATPAHEPADVAEAAPSAHGADPAAESHAATEPAHAAPEGAAPEENPLLAHMGQSPDLEIADVGDRSEKMTAEGGTCLPDEALDLSAWGSDRGVADQIGPIRQGMVLEFDKPDADAIIRVIRFYLHIGFGAEARSLIRTYGDVLPEAQLWTSMAHILDAEPDVGGAFTGMEDCDTAAALWAVLADPTAIPKDEIGRAAIARNFSALPPLIRRLVGPRLVRGFLAADDMRMAYGLYEAVLRAPGDPGPEEILMQAEMDRARGEHGKSEAKLEPLAESPGPSSSEAMADLVIQRARLGQSVSEEQVLALEAALKERSGSEDEPHFHEALVLGHAASGNFDTAFAEAEGASVRGVIWRLLGQSGGDGALLDHGTLAPGQAPPAEAVLSAGLIADRFLNLGLSDQAARWLTLAPDPPAVLRARVALANGDAPRAIELLGEDTSEPALHVKAEALKYMGDEAGAAQVYQELGRSEEQWSALSRAESWSAFGEEAPPEWKGVTDLVTGEAVTPPEDPLAGPLARDRALVDSSAATRDAIDALLKSVEVPAPPSQ